jgi:serine/threonine protein kinase
MDNSRAESKRVSLSQASSLSGSKRSELASAVRRFKGIMSAKSPTSPSPGSISKISGQWSTNSSQPRVPQSVGLNAQAAQIDIKAPSPSEWAGVDRMSLKDFELIIPLGSGSFGQAFLYRHIATGKPVVLKRVDATSVRAAAAAKNEVRILSEIAPFCSPYLLCYEGSFEEKRVDANGKHVIDEYIATQWIPGYATLADAIKKPGWPANAVQLAQVFVGLRKAVESIHAAGVVHRDIKPENILVQLNGNGVRLIDFGLACDVVNVSCQKHATVGTPFYMAPEVGLQTAIPESAAIDLWSVGLTIWTTLLKSVTVIAWNDARDRVTQLGLTASRRLPSGGFRPLLGDRPPPLSEDSKLELFWREFDYNSPTDVLAGENAKVENMLTGLAAAYRFAFPNQPKPNLSLRSLLLRDPRLRKFTPITPAAVQRASVSAVSATAPVRASSAIAENKNRNN